jgi:hypothetical protein
MPNEVNVEKELTPTLYEGKQWSDPSTHFDERNFYMKESIKLNSQGTVDITIPEEKMYSREEVLNLLDFVNERLPDLYSRFNLEEELNDWISENLNT